MARLVVMAALMLALFACGCNTEIQEQSTSSDSRATSNKDDKVSQNRATEEPEKNSRRDGTRRDDSSNSRGDDPAGATSAHLVLPDPNKYEYCRKLLQQPRVMLSRKGGTAGSFLLLGESKQDGESLVFELPKQPLEAGSYQATFADFRYDTEVEIGDNGRIENNIELPPVHEVAIVLQKSDTDEPSSQKKLFWRAKGSQKMVPVPVSDNAGEFYFGTIHEKITLHAEDVIKAVSLQPGVNEIRLESPN